MIKVEEVEGLLEFSVRAFRALKQAEKYFDDLGIDLACEGESDSDTFYAIYEPLQDVPDVVIRSVNDYD